MCEVTGLGGLSRRRSEQGLGVRLDVMFADAASRAPAFYLVDVDSEFSRQTPHVRRRGCGCAMFRACHLAQLLRHGKRLGTRSRRLIRQDYLGLGLTLGCYRGLQRQASFVLFGNVFHWTVFQFFRWRGGATLQGENHLANFDLLAFFDPDLFHRAGHRRWNFDHGFFGLQFHHRLSFGNFRAGRNHEPHQVTLVDVFTQFRQSEFGSSSGRLRLRCRKTCRRTRFRRLRRRRCWGLWNGGRRFLGCRFWSGSCGPGGFSFCAGTVFDRENYLTNLDLLSLFNADFFHRTGHRRWNLDHGLVRFQFHHGLAFSNARTRRNHQPHQVALIDVLAEFR